MSLPEAISRLAPAFEGFEPGHVWLAGAGPGSLGCLTLEVVAALDQADAVVYDALVDPAVLNAAAGNAELHFVGKRRGQPSTDQDSINRLLVQLASAGQRVLRLKGGDPSIFGRGGEEALALARAGVPFRVLPGVTSAFGALADAQIPATRRGVSRALILATGHGVGTADDLDWAALARTGQPIVVYMGLSGIAEIAAALIAGGMAPSMPAAVIASATTAEERIVVADLASIAGEVRSAGIRAPALIVIGAIVALREELMALARNDAPGMTARALIVGGARSGSGKTSVAIGLMRALRRRGLRVRGAKSGPDYIDPGFHAAACGAPGVNLDSWAMAPALLDRLATEQAEDADLLVIESAMGLFDGIPASFGRSGAAADLARRYGIPVLLVLDVSGQSQTAAAIARGFAAHDAEVRIAGIVLNQVASPRHEALVREAIGAIGLPVIGAVHRNPDMALPERHLGLVQASEHAELEAFIGRLADIIERSVDLDAIIDLALPLRGGPGDAEAALPPPGQRIAVAEDAAFSFVYPHLARHWRALGAELVPFSPLADQGPDPSSDACWLPGGYPELHAGWLAAASGFRDALRRFAAGRPVHGECGGFMVLGRALEDAAGVTHQMTGLLGHVTSYARRKMHLGYRQARLLQAAPIGRAGQRVRGHEFHYSQLLVRGQDAPLAELFDGQGNLLGLSGARRGNVTGTFFHAIAAE